MKRSSLLLVSLLSLGIACDGMAQTCTLTGPPSTVAVFSPQGALTGAGTMSNLGLGYAALGALSTGVNNVCFGPLACPELTTGQGNIGIGVEALRVLSSGDSNIGIGPQSLGTLTTGSGNVAIGQGAGDKLSTGRFNTYLGTEAGFFATLGSENVFLGFEAGQWMTTGDRNTSVGAAALYGRDSSEISTGASITAIGYSAGNSSPVPENAVTSGTFLTFLGANAGLGSPTQRTNSTAIGSQATVDADNTVVLGNASVTDVFAGQNGGAAVHAGAVAFAPVTTRPTCDVTRRGVLIFVPETDGHNDAWQRCGRDADGVYAWRVF